MRGRRTLWKTAHRRAIEAAFARVPKDTQADHVLEEVLAYLVENSPETTLVRRVITMVKRALVKMGFSPDIFSARDLAALAEVAVRSRDGKDNQAGNARGKGENQGTAQEGDQEAGNRLSVGAARISSVNPEDLNSEEFLNWFGESTVVEEGGTPTLVYHGSPTFCQSYDTHSGTLNQSIQNREKNCSVNIGLKPPILSCALK
jgi:hypothetical protein